MKCNTILITCFLISSLSIAQSFEFKWNITRDINWGTTVLVERSGQKQLISFIEESSGDTCQQYIESVDCDSIFYFMTNIYPYIHSYSSKLVDENKHYHDTIYDITQDRILIEGKTIRPELMSVFGYYFDSTKQKFYSYDGRIVIEYVGGYIYSGFFKSENKEKDFQFQCFPNKYDIRLNKTMLNLILKYNKDLDLTLVEYVLEAEN